MYKNQYKNSTAITKIGVKLNLLIGVKSNGEPRSRNTFLVDFTNLRWYKNNSN